jgi:hypothetical protein
LEIDAQERKNLYGTNPTYITTNEVAYKGKDNDNSEDINMPLLPGKKNIGHNIEEMQKAGHPHDQAVAASLHKAYDRTGNHEADRQAQEKHKYGR